MVWVLLATACDGTSPEPPAPATPAAPAVPVPQTKSAQAGAAAPEAAAVTAGTTSAKTTPTAPSNGTPTPAAAESAARAAAPGSEAPAAAEPAKGSATEASAGEDTAAAKLKPEEPPTVKQPLTRVLLLGDSMIATGFGVKLESLLDKTAGIVAYRKGKSVSSPVPTLHRWPRAASGARPRARASW